MLLASTFTIGKAVLCFINPILFIGIRMTIGGLLLLMYLIWQSPREIRFKGQDWWLYLESILFHIYFAFIFQYIALEGVDSAKAALLYNLSPFITALLSRRFLAEQLSRTKFLGLIIGFCGLIPWILTQRSGEYKNVFLSFSYYELILLLAVVSASYGWIILKRLIHKDYSPVFINGFSMLAAGILALITSLITEGFPSLLYMSQSCPVDEPGIAYLSEKVGVYGAQILLIALYTTLLIIIGNVIFYNLYGYLLKRYSATFLSFAGFTCPLFAALFGWLYLGEVVSFTFFISFFVVFIGLYLFYQQELQ